jgi:hypothetical protein
LKTIKNNYLPEYDQLISVIYSIDMKEYTKYSIEDFINIDDVSNLKDMTIVEYFSHVKLNQKIVNDSTDTTSAQDLLSARISKRKSYKLTINMKYDKFIIMMNNDLLDEAYMLEYQDIYVRIKDFIKNVTSEYKLNENILMRNMNQIIKNDEDMTHEASAHVMQNIRTILEKVMIDIVISETIKSDLLDTTNINTAKYITFARFESKMQMLSKSDMDSLHIYIDSTQKKIQQFRRHIRMQESVFSKKFQLHAVYENIHSVLFVGCGILLMIHFYKEIFSRSNPLLAAATKGMKETAAIVARRKEKKAKAKAKKSKKTNDDEKKESSTNADSNADTNNGTNEGTNEGTSGGGWYTKGGIAPDSSDATTQPATKPTDTEPTGESKQNVVSNQSKSIKLALILIVFAVFFTFFKSYLMKHKADIYYDRIINVTNTSKFEIEVDNYRTLFKKYKNNRSDVSLCKELYYKMIEVIEIYNKCNFIKNSMKTTPFPFTEMWTNGVIMVIFFAILYITLINTDAGQFWSNAAALNNIIKDTNKVFEHSFIEKKVDKYRGKYEKYLNEEPVDYEGLHAELTKYNTKIVNKEAKGSFGSKLADALLITDPNKKKATYTRIVKEQFENTGTTGVADTSTVMAGGMMPMQMGPSVQDERNERNRLELAAMDRKVLAEETETLRQYEKQYMMISTKLAYFNRDAKYVNVTLAVSIVLFGSYFCINIIDNSKRYANMLSSGGIFGDCL